MWSFTTCSDTTPPIGKIIKPISGYIYRDDKEILKRVISPVPIIFGDITITVSASDTGRGSGINRVEFYIDTSLVANDTNAPYSWEWNTRAPKRNTVIKIIVVDNADNTMSILQPVWKFR